MSESEKFLKMFGGIFLSIGILVLGIGVAIIAIFNEWLGGGIPTLIGIIFSAVGGGILISQFRVSAKRKEIEKQGDHFTGKIYGYVEDKSCTMNGDFLINIKVRYFDKRGIEREAVIPTGFTRGSGDFPIGATIDIIVLNTSCSWVKGSVRYEHIYGEEELMDDKPIDPSLIDMVGVSCPNCGASFSAAKGYSSKCPYCGSTINC